MRVCDICQLYWDAWQGGEELEESCWGCGEAGRPMTGEELWKLGDMMMASGVVEEMGRGGSLKVAAEAM